MKDHANLVILVTVIFATVVLTIAISLIVSENKEPQGITEGEAKAEFIWDIHGIEVRPEVAKHINVSIHMTDIVISPAELNVWEPQAGWESFAPEKPVAINGEELQ